jgi:hypothetical protein
MAQVFEERRFARWICRSCRAARFATIPRDGRLKCPICYAGEPFDPKRHAPLRRTGGRLGQRASTAPLALASHSLPRREPPPSPPFG